MTVTESKIVAHDFSRQSSWQGRSGRAFGMVSENLDHFAMSDVELYVLAKGSHVLWVGSTGELVGDPMSRSRFRLAFDCADRVFRVLNSGAAAERLSTIWDLEGAAPLASARAA